jgi:hypothetical protein
MLGFLRGVPGKLTALATQITGLGTPASQASVTALGSPAQASALTTLTTNVGSPLQASSPLQTPPMAGGVIGTGASIGTASAALNLAAAIAGIEAKTTSTTDVTVVNVTGKGVLNFVAGACSFSTTSSPRLTIIIDGVTLWSAVALSSTPYQYGVLVGTLSLTDGSNTTLFSAGLDQIPFNSSLVIKHNSSAGGWISTYYKYRRTA